MTFIIVIRRSSCLLFIRIKLEAFQEGSSKKHTSSDLGYLKMRFFDSISIFKPAVTIMLFDYSHESPSSFDWSDRESKIMDELKRLQEKCPVSSKDTKI
jgi:hypothetical protein